MTGPNSNKTDSNAYDPAEYGEAHADVYDRIYRSFPTADAVTRIAELANHRDGPVLDLGIGTGRLAIPLRAAGINVHGLDASPAMITRLRAQPGGTAIPVWQTDMATFDLPARYSVVVCAVSTLFMLPDRDTHIACLRRAARHLAPGGVVVIEAFVPDPRRYDPDGRRLELRHLDDNSLHLVASDHDPTTQTIAITHVLAGNHGLRRYPVTLDRKLGVTTASAGRPPPGTGTMVISTRWGWPPTPDSASSTAPADGTTAPTPPPPPTTSVTMKPIPAEQRKEVGHEPDQLRLVGRGPKRRPAVAAMIAMNTGSPATVRGPGAPRA